MNISQAFVAHLNRAMCPVTDLEERQTWNVTFPDGQDPVLEEPGPSAGVFLDEGATSCSLIRVVSGIAFLLIVCFAFLYRKSVLRKRDEEKKAYLFLVQLKEEKEELTFKQTNFINFINSDPQLSLRVNDLLKKRGANRHGWSERAEGTSQTTNLEADIILIKDKIREIIEVIVSDSETMQIFKERMRKRGPLLTDSRDQINSRIVEIEC